MSDNKQATADGFHVLPLAKVYTVTHLVFGTFTARTVESGPGWCAFCIIDSNPRLTRMGYPEGSYIEISAPFFEATPL
jgi:hypothetical protein